MFKLFLNKEHHTGRCVDGLFMLIHSWYDPLAGGANPMEELPSGYLT
jgi:hypothetical protein